ncbi:MAG: sulfatase [Rikenellaceae bacterium]
MQTISNSKVVCGATLLTALTTTGAFANDNSSTPKRPNVVWYMTEDLSPQYMALYNNGVGGQTPNLDKIAQEGIVFNRAYSNAAVSSAARTSLITGCFAPRFGGALHRRLQLLPMPEGLNMFPTYLRKEGYYTCNAAKTDYNVLLDEQAWDKINGKLGDWRLRPNKEQPFFYVRTNGVTHESSLLFDEDRYKNVKTRNNPDNITPHPTLPNTDLVRYTYATFYDRIEESDKEFGQLIEMLKEDGLYEDTFIFFFGDNGGSLPGSKGYTNDVGLHVPLVVYVPEAWREQIGIKAGSHTDGMVSFMDFGPTILALAGIDTPQQMDGRPFLTKAHPTGFDDVVCYGDRYDDLYAFFRVLYEGKYRYARSYQPYHPQSLFSYYRYKSLSFQEWRKLYRAGKLNKDQSAFFEPYGTEKLFDTESDPNELNNLANDPKYKEILLSMRSKLASYLDEKVDLGFLPEAVLYEDAIKNPAGYGASHKKEISTYRKVADLQLQPYSLASKELSAALNSHDLVEKWWALTTAAHFAKEAEALKPTAQKLLSNERSFIASRAMVFLARAGVKPSRTAIDALIAGCRTTAETLLILNDLAYLKECRYIDTLNVNALKFPDASAKERVIFLNREEK